MINLPNYWSLTALISSKNFCWSITFLLFRSTVFVLREDFCCFFQVCQKLENEILEATHWSSISLFHNPPKNEFDRKDRFYLLVWSKGWMLQKCVKYRPSVLLHWTFDREEHFQEQRGGTFSRNISHFPSTSFVIYSLPELCFLCRTMGRTLAAAAIALLAVIASVSADFQKIHYKDCSKLIFFAKISKMNLDIVALFYWWFMHKSINLNFWTNEFLFPVRMKTSTPFLTTV